MVRRFLIGAAIGWAGCGAGGSEAAPDVADASSSDVQPWLDVTGGSPDSGSDPSATVCPRLEIGADSDGDGLPDILEDANRNGTLDEGETDPCAVDSDGDGLPDGEEDLDRNGVWDEERGEFDPRRADTWNTGEPDGRSVLSVHCRASWFGQTASLLVPTRDGGLFHAGSDLTVVTLESLPGTAVFDERLDAGALLLSGIESVHGVATVPTDALGVAGVLGAHLETLGEETSTPAGPWTGSFRLRFPFAVRTDLLLRGLASALGTEMHEPFPELSEYDSFDVTVQADVRDAGTLGHRVAITVAPTGSGVRTLVGLHAIAPRGVQQALPSCARLDAGRRERVSVVLVVDGRAPSASLNSVALAALRDVTEARARVGLKTEIWVVRSDAHVGGAAGATANPEPLSTVDEVEAVLSGLADASADHRVWYNARAALEWLERTDTELPADRVVLVTGADEDAEFRTGQYGGLDGDPAGRPLAPGDPVRLDRTAYYARFFAERDMTVVGVVRGDSSCAGGESTGETMPVSVRDIALATGGAAYSGCADGAGDLATRVLQREIGPWLTPPWRVSVAGDSVRLIRRQGDEGVPELVPEDWYSVFVGADAETSLLLQPAVEPVSWGVVYLQWDERLTQQRGR